ncbi:MAG TPA: hypothetical protein GXZ36_02215 [Firmicutes bacterium]|nr:hypothetical protein [Bacillota bacterium]
MLRRYGHPERAAEARKHRKRAKAALTNLWYFNFLLFLVLCCTALSLRVYLTSKVIPVAVHGNGSGERVGEGGVPASGRGEYVSLWELRTGIAKRLLQEGLPLLQARNKPQTLDERPRGFFKFIFQYIFPYF